jgi:hypothetical protein
MDEARDIPVVRVIELSFHELPPGLMKTGLGCFDNDSGGANAYHIWIVPIRTGGRRFFRAVTGNSIMDEVPHRGTRDDLKAVRLVDHKTETVIFRPDDLARV